MQSSWTEAADADQLGEAASMAVIVFTRLEEILRARHDAAETISALAAGELGRARRTFQSVLEAAPEFERLARSLGQLAISPPGTSTGKTTR